MTFDHGGHRIRLVAARGGGFFHRRVVGEFRRQYGFCDDRLRYQSGEAADQVFEFAHVAGPAIGGEHGHGAGIDGFGGQALGLRLVQKMLREDGDVVGAFTQGRQADGDDVEAVEQVFAELAAADEGAQVAMGGGDDAGIGANRLAAADGGEFAFLQHAQQAGLGLGRHVADFIQEERAAIRLFEAADMAVGGAGEGAAFVAEQLGFDQFARDGGHVDGDERAGAAAAVIVQGAGDEFLAGAGFAVDHDGEVGGREAGDNAIDFLHRGAAADQRQRFLGLFFDRRGRRRRQRLLHGAIHHGEQIGKVDGQIIKRAALRRLHRGRQRALRAHHDHRQLRPDAADARHEVQAVFVGHDDVGNHQVALAVLHPAPQRRGRGGGADLVAGTAQSLRQDRADGTVVIGDQHGRQGGHASSLS